jgi:hypothetical protein
MVANTVNMLWKEAGITSLEEFDGAARSGRREGLRWVPPEQGESGELGAGVAAAEAARV